MQCLRGTVLFWDDERVQDDYIRDANSFPSLEVSSLNPVGLLGY